MESNKKEKERNRKLEQTGKLKWTKLGKKDKNAIEIIFDNYTG